MGADSTDNSTTDDKTTTTTDATDAGKSTTDGTDKAAAKDKAGASSDADKAAADKVSDDSNLKKALAAERKRADAAEKTLRDGELAKLPELDRYKTLADTLAKENEELKTDNLRRQVAMELNLPWKIGKRLSGETLEEMRDDGADLAKDYKADGGKTVIPDDSKNKAKTNDTKKTGGSVGPSINDKLRALAGRTTI